MGGSRIPASRRTCATCKQIKPREEFGIFRSGRIKPFCRGCGHAPRKSRKSKPPQVGEKWGLTPLQYGRLYRRLYPYGISLEEFFRMMSEQNGKCAICEEIRALHLHIDHCHETNQVRKLLCRQCNNGLGLFKDNPALLEAAARYLKDHKKIQGRPTDSC